MFNFMLSVVPLKLRICLFFLYKQRYFWNPKEPKTFSEKIQCRKFNLTKNMSIYADKYAVRKYVENKIGSEYLIPLLWYSSASDFVDFPDFDEHAVIKTNHGSGVNHIEFLPTKKSKEEVVEKFKSSLSESYVGSVLGETQYDHIPRKVIIEKKLHKNGVVPVDFKFHVFNNGGEPVSFLQVDFDRFHGHKRNYYDHEFNPIDLSVIYPSGDYSLPDETYLLEMRKLAFKLLGDLGYARIDLYLFDEKVYFGEITLTPGSGFEKFSNKFYDEMWGKLWK